MDKLFRNGSEVRLAPGTHSDGCHPGGWYRRSALHLDLLEHLGEREHFSSLLAAHCRVESGTQTEIHVGMRQTCAVRAQLEARTTPPGLHSLKLWICGGTGRRRLAAPTLGNP